jgi:1-acyl-sn-glycerol-3-phosphate acyltransferase
MKYNEANHPWIYGAAHKGAEGLEKRKRDLRVRGADLIPSSGAALLGYSHREVSDPRVAGVIVPDRAVHLMAKKELWERQYWYGGYLLQLLGAFPVDRARIAPSTVKYTKMLLKQGKLVGIFGEETRYEDEDKKIVRGNLIGDISPGLGYFAVMFNVDIYPVGISHMLPEEIKGRGGEIKRAVIGLPDSPNPELPRNDAIADITARHRISLQSVYDEANEWARAA